MEHFDGDLLDPAHAFDAIGHGVNLRGAMAAGIAGKIADRWPGIVEPYKRACAGGRFVLGGVLPYQPEGGPRVYNLATQGDPGAHAELDAVWSAVSLALVDCWRKGIDHLALPEVGCGIGGLDWERYDRNGDLEYDTVLRVLEDLDAASPVEIVVVHFPVTAP